MMLSSTQLASVIGMDELFQSRINSIRLFERDDQTYSIMNERLSGGLSVNFSRQELAALQFIVDQAVANIEVRQDAELLTKHREDHVADASKVIEKERD